MLLKKIEGVTRARRPRTTFLNFVYRRNLKTGTPPKFFRAILCLEALVYSWYFCRTAVLRKQDGNYSTSDFHTNTLISHTFAYSSRWRRKPLQGLFTKTTEIKTTLVWRGGEVGDTHFTRDMCTGIHISRGYTYHLTPDHPKGSQRNVPVQKQNDLLLIQKKLFGKKQTNKQNKTKKNKETWKKS